MAIVAFILERLVMRSVKRSGDARGHATASTRTPGASWVNVLKGRAGVD